MKAIWNNAVVAESNDTVVVENNHYFPADSVKQEYFEDSIAHTTCPWKGQASYYSLRANGYKKSRAHHTAKRGNGFCLGNSISRSNATLQASALHG